MTAATDSNPFFTVIISSRNRPTLFQRALQSVVDQTLSDKEIVIVVDGSSHQYLDNYAEIEKQNPSVKFMYLEHRETGHGQSYTMNYGMDHSIGKYLCFLDDDDFWTDDTYLDAAYKSISSSERPVDLHYSNQKAFRADGTVQEEDVWLEDLIPQILSATVHVGDSYFVNADFLLRSEGFGHLNCSIFSREFYHAIGGMDESIRYENDRDVFIRSIDAANTVLYSTRYVSRHNIPDSRKRDNMSTVASDIDKKLFQIRVYDKGICLGQHPAVIERCRKGKTYELKHLTEIFVSKSDYSNAAYYAREALSNGFNLRWLAYSLYIGFKALVSRGDGS